MKSTLWLTTILLLSASTGVKAGAVVVAKGSPVSAIDAGEVKKIFMGRQSTAGSASLTVIYQKGGSARSDFENKVLGKSGAELDSYWAKLVFTGKGTAPTEVGGDPEVKAKVNATAGAIGYISDAAIDDSVKVLLKY